MKLDKFSGYQTIKLPDGEIINGLFPTIDWFNKIRVHVPFQDKTVLDVGCCDGMYSILALEAGATQAVGIEEDTVNADNAKKLGKLWNVDFSVLNNRTEQVDFDDHLDIVLFPMIIHWIGFEETRRLITWAKDYVVFIYREANPDYLLPTNGVWFPTEKELDQRFPQLVKIHSQLLMEQDNGKKINLAIYEKHAS